MIAGYATAAGTERYRGRFSAARDAGHFRHPERVLDAGELWFPSFGLGTYLGETDAAADARYTEAIATALRGGINLLDSAINYRHQRSERNIGAALAELIAKGELARDEVIVCTKAGYLSFDGEPPADPRAYLQQEYIASGILDPREIAGGMHSMAPKFLQDQIERSRKNLGLETIDVFYLHNPETQLGEVDTATFERRIGEAFDLLEKKVKKDKLRYYGVATWNAFRHPAGQRGALSLPRLLEIARDVGGHDHHFRFVQMPFNLAMPEAFVVPNQHLETGFASMLEAAEKLGVAVIGSATLHQAALTEGLPLPLRQVLGMSTDADNAVQFARSAPGLTTALIGMGRKEHVEENLRVAASPLLPAEQWFGLFRQTA